MIVYLLLFGVPAALAILEMLRRRTLAPWVMLGVVAACMILMGFRETGGDFTTYVIFLENSAGKDFEFVVVRTEPLYGILNMIANATGGGIYLVNLVCSAIFLTGLYRFAQQEPIPQLTWAIASAYLLIVVAIGYTRQGTAIGMILWAIAELRLGKNRRFLLLLVLAIGFHTSAAMALLLGPRGINLQNGYARLGSSALFILSGIAGVFYGLDSALERYQAAYASDHYSSDGALLRIGLSAAAALLFAIKGKILSKDEYGLWLIFAAMTLGSLAILPVQSTVADRLALYTIPLQLVMFGRVPLLFRNTMVGNLAALAVIAGYGGVLAIWLFAGNFAGELWLPYENLLFGPIA